MRAARTFTRGVLVPMLAATALFSLVGACGVFVSFDYGVSGKEAPDSGLFAVGGTVSGLGHSRVTLVLNGDRRLTVGDGLFTFPAAGADGATFSVTVPEPPFSHPCSLDHAAGTIAGKDEDGIAVSCPSNNAQIALTIDRCINVQCDESGSVPLPFVPTQLTYEVSVNPSTRLRIKVQAVEARTIVRLPGATFDPRTLISVATIEIASPTTIDIDVIAPDQTTRLRYSVTVKLYQVTE
ncbi:MAG: trimeric autotransporter adhesin [Myxococcales bacterium]|jgi:hypothetical protein|nr:trimeric autotransporter adhesin [Myxococcales bacterium]